MPTSTHPIVDKLASYMKGGLQKEQILIQQDMQERMESFNFILVNVIACLLSPKVRLMPRVVPSCFRQAVREICVEQLAPRWSEYDSSSASRVSPLM